jgi:hypothetical protein
MPRIYNNSMNYETTPCPAGFEQTIIKNIRTAEIKADKRSFIVRWFGLGSLSLASLAGTIASAIYLVDAMNTSGTFQYISLALSDSGSVSSYWKELLLSVLESVPAFGIAVLLAAVGLFLWSAARTLRSTPRYALA